MLQVGSRVADRVYDITRWVYDITACFFFTFFCCLSSLSYRRSLFSSSQDVSSRSGRRCWKESHRRAFKQGTVNTWICLMTSLIQVNTAALTLTLSLLCVCRCFRMWWSVCSSQTSQRKLWWVSLHYYLLVIFSYSQTHCLFVNRYINPYSHFLGTDDTIWIKGTVHAKNVNPVLPDDIKSSQEEDSMDSLRNPK